MAAERDQTKTPRFMSQYCLMRVSALSPVWLSTDPLIPETGRDRESGPGLCIITQRPARSQRSQARSNNAARQRDEVVESDPSLVDCLIT